MKLLYIVKFAYNNAKNISKKYISFEFNYKYYPSIFYKKDIDLYSQLKTINNLTNKLRNPMATYKENIKYA